MQAVITTGGSRVLVVGLGRAGALTIQALKDRDDAEVVAGVDPAPAASTLELVGRGRVFAAVDRLPPALAVDVVVVATPTPSHAEVCRALTAMGFAPVILCEKPLATSAGEVDALLADARQAGVDLRVLYHYAHAAEVVWAYERLDELVGEHGAVVALDGTFADCYRGEIEARASVLVSSWIDAGINALSVALRFVRLRQVLATDLRERSPGAGSVTLSFDGPAGAGAARIDTSWSAEEEVKRTRLEFADASTLELDHLLQTVVLERSSGRELLFAGTSALPVRERRYRDLLDAHLRGLPSVYGAAETRLLHLLLVAATEAPALSTG